MSYMIPPRGGELKVLKLEGEALAEALHKAKSLKQITITTRERDDLIMMGIGAFSPLRGFMGKVDWRGVCDGVFIHQLVGALKPGGIPAEVRVKCVNTLVEHYFPKERVVQKGYPLEMRYAGPGEALLHACFRQNYGATHLIVGRDHAGVGDYYGPFEAEEIFDEIPQDALVSKGL